jgi:hypothetical protein
MAIQTFTSGQVLTAAQQNALQTNDYNWTVSAKVASYSLVAGDKGTIITMTNAAATTITANTTTLATGDIVKIMNLGAGACTLTSGTCTISSAGSLVLGQYASGSLWFTSTNTAIFIRDASQPQVAIFNETQAAGTNGGIISAATWTKRTLNTTQTNTISGCSIAASVITLGPGTYSINAQPNQECGDSWKARLQNTTDATTTLFSQNAYSISSSAYAATIAPIMGTFTITAQKNFEIQQYAQTVTGATGLGRGVAAYTSLFTQVEITRFA